MIFIINEYHFKNNNNDNKKGFGTINKKNDTNDAMFEQQKLFKRFNTLIMKIDELSFLNLNNVYLSLGVNLSTEMLLLDSNKRLKEQKEKIISEFESLNKFDKKSLETIMIMANNKLDLLFEQNILISHLITMFKNMKNETNKYYNIKILLKKDINQTMLFEQDKNYQKLNQNEKNKFLFNSNTKDLIINFLKEAIFTEDGFLKVNQTSKSIKPDFKFDKNNSFTQIIIDHPEELDNKDNKVNEIFECFNENEFNELNDLVTFKRKERRK